MLPAQGMHIEHYRRILHQTDQVWGKLCRQFPMFEATLQTFLQAPLVQMALTELGVQDQGAEPIKRALLLLHHSLGSHAVNHLFKLQETETVVAALRLIYRSDESRMASVDIQMAVLTAAVLHLCVECGGDQPLSVMFHLLNKIPLIHNTHDILVQQVTLAVEGQKRVVH